MILYGVNDIYDEASDSKSQVRSWAGGLALVGTRHKIVWWGIIMASSMLLLSAWLLNLATFLIAVGAVVAAFLYSAPPVRLKERPVVDALFSGFFYVVVIYTIGFIQGSALSSLPLEVWALGLLASALHLYAAARDYTADTAARLTTTAVMLGRRGTLTIVAGMVLVTWFVWCFERSFDFTAYLLFFSLFIAALLAWYFDDELFIKRSLYVLVPIATLVGIYKILF
jgi:4-hydroxybenzoate polyprenyltransferase